MDKAKRRSPSRNLDFNLDLEYLLSLFEEQQRSCYYTGIALSLDSGNWAVSIDRKDPKQGYVKGNIALCCFLVNKMKSSMDIPQFLILCRMVLSYSTSTSDLDSED